MGFSLGSSSGPLGIHMRKCPSPMAEGLQPKSMPTPNIPSWIWIKTAGLKGGKKPAGEAACELLSSPGSKANSITKNPPLSSPSPCPNRRQEMTLPKLFTTQSAAGAGEKRWEGEREGGREGKKPHTTSLSVDFLSKSQQTVQSGTESSFSQLNLTSDAPESFMSIQKF